MTYKMTIGAELRAIRDGAVVDTKQRIKDWFDEHMDELKGAALGGADCIIYDDEKTFEFFENLFNENETILADFCSEQSVEIELGRTDKKIIIFWGCQSD